MVFPCTKKVLILFFTPTNTPLTPLLFIYYYCVKEKQVLLNNSAFRLSQHYESLNAMFQDYNALTQLSHYIEQKENKLQGIS
jgi:hypothetical protein